MIARDLFDTAQAGFAYLGLPIQQFENQSNAVRAAYTTLLDTLAAHSADSDSVAAQAIVTPLAALWPGAPTNWATMNGMQRYAFLGVVQAYRRAS